LPRWRVERVPVESPECQAMVILSRFRAEPGAFADPADPSLVARSRLLARRAPHRAAINVSLEPRDLARIRKGLALPADVFPH
jgi:hypothetical protein